ncbi:hypothetical protein [Methylibium sp.]|uniref:hypothetical protein n=1 Tax=Methylibium sp. TaxID=2067992 RepID=UPI003BABD1D0
MTDRAPLTPTTCDLRDFLRMPLEVGRLLSSETWIAASDDPRLGHVLMSLWCEAWREVPAGSLPNTDRTLFRMSMCPSEKEWKRVRARVVESFVLCNDGRLYHPTVCEMALEGMLEKLAMRKSSGLGNAKKHGKEFDPADLEREMETLRDMLRALNPASRALQRKRTAAVPTGTQKRSRTPPDGSPDGSPSGSQEKGSEGIFPPTPRATSVDNSGRGWGTVAEVEAKARAKGIGPWDRAAWESGRGGDDWLAYKRKVRLAHGIDENHGLPASVAEVLTGVVRTH